MELSLALCDEPEGREAQEGGGVCMQRADSLHCRAGTQHCKANRLQCFEKAIFKRSYIELEFPCGV